MVRILRAVFVVLLVVGGGVAAAQSPQAADGPVIVAQGEATVKQPADVAWVQIAVMARGAKPADARQQAALVMTSVMTTLKQSVPADALKTSGFSVQPEMEYSNNVPRVRDYVARNQIEARVDDLEKLSGVLDASVGSGATSVAGLRFDVKARSKWEREALRLAVEDATERAQAIATGANRTLGPVVRIQEQRVSGQSFMNFNTDAVRAVGGAPAQATPVAPGEIEIRGQVVLTVSIK